MISAKNSSADPTLKDVLDLYKTDAMLSINCHAIGTVQSFDSSAQTITATINYKRTYVQTNPDGTTSQVLTDYPLLLDVPTVVMCGGSTSLTFPIKSGDTCLILFNDRDMDNWFKSGQVVGVATPRLHSLADGIALVGIRSQNNPISPYDASRVVLQNGTTMIGLSDSLIKIGNNTGTLGPLLQNILTQLQTLAASVCVPGNPIAPAVATQLATYASQLEEILE